MLDHCIESHLFCLLSRQEGVTLEDICWWDSQRAEDAALTAGLERKRNAIEYTPGPDTSAWMEETWNEIRRARRENDIRKAMRLDAEASGKVIRFPA